MKLGVIIPALDEEATIADAVRRVPRSIEGIDCIEVVVIDDGSTDATANNARAAEVMRTLQSKERIRTAEVTREEVVESQTRRVAYGDFSYAYAEYLKMIGEHCPEMVGPNRAAARLSPEKAVRRFHRECRRKIRLQQQGCYRHLSWRKLTLEIRPFLYRYIRWFFVTILKIKWLLGMGKEVSEEQLSGFCRLPASWSRVCRRMGNVDGSCRGMPV